MAIAYPTVQLLPLQRNAVSLQSLLGTPSTRQRSISRICTATRASPLPLVEMVMVKGLNNQQAILSLINLAGTRLAERISPISLHAMS